MTEEKIIRFIIFLTIDKCKMLKSAINMGNRELSNIISSTSSEGVLWTDSAFTRKYMALVSLYNDNIAFVSHKKAALSVS